MEALVQLGSVFTVKQPSGSRNGKRRVVSRQWAVFQCSCGTRFPSPLKPIADGRTKSCGCYSRTKFVKAAAEYNDSGGSTTHGQCSTGAYISWASMLQRCINPNSSGYYMFLYATNGPCLRTSIQTWDQDQMGRLWIVLTQKATTAKKIVVGLLLKNRPTTRPETDT
jgi:hypothetical protein